MGIFKKIKAIESQIANLALAVAEIKDEIEQLKEKLPDYEHAVAKGVDDVWNKALQSVIDYNPYKKYEDGEA